MLFAAAGLEAQNTMRRLKKISKLILAGLLAGGLVPACGADQTVDEEVILDAEDLELEAGDKADSLASTSTYYSARPDFRRCAYPMCGGTWVKRLNKSTTKCADGRYASECYVAELDWAALGLHPDQEAAVRDGMISTRSVFRGRIARRDINGKNWGAFVPSEAWLGTIEATVEGVFRRVTDSGIRCITAPCPSMHAANLNSAVHRNITDLAGDAITEKVPNEIGNDGGVLVAGTIYRRGRAYVLEATQAYLRVIPAPIEPPPAEQVPCATDADCAPGTTCQPAYVCITFPCDAPLVCR